MPSIAHTSGYETILLGYNASTGPIYRISETSEEQKFSFNIQLTYDIMTTITKFNNPRPVFVEKDENGNEIVVYNSFAMEIGKEYPILYKGEKWALKRTEKDVEFMKFYPKKK